MFDNLFWNKIKSLKWNSIDPILWRNKSSLKKSYTIQFGPSLKKWMKSQSIKPKSKVKSWGTVFCKLFWTIDNFIHVNYLMTSTVCQFKRISNLIQNKIFDNRLWNEVKSLKWNSIIRSYINSINLILWRNKLAPKNRTQFNLIHSVYWELILEKGPFKYSVIKEVGGWGQIMAVLMIYSTVNHQRGGWA